MSTITPAAAAAAEAAATLADAEAAFKDAERRAREARKAKAASDADLQSRREAARNDFEAARAAAFEDHYLAPVRGLEAAFARAVTDGDGDPVTAWVELNRAAKVAQVEHDRFTDWERRRVRDRVERLRGELEEFNEQFAQIRNTFGRPETVQARALGRIVGVDHGRGTPVEYAEALATVNRRVKEWADANELRLEVALDNDNGYRPEIVVPDYPGVASRDNRPLPLRPILDRGFSESVEAVARDAMRAAAETHTRAVNAEVAGLLE